MRDEEERQDLRVRTKEFALRIIRRYSALSKTEVSSVIGRQVLRSGTSVGANYREAYRARCSAEFISKLGDGLKELEETAYWLELLVESGCMPAIKLADLLGEASELTAIFTSIFRRLRNRPSS
jgi:four helix bundle protein